MTAPTVFISYSHKDKDLLGPLLAQLKALEQAELLEVWADTRIDAGDRWYPEIETAMKQAAVAVCLVSEYFLASDFCTKQEVPFLLKRSADEGMLIVPILLSECVWQAHRWLRDTQMLPGESQSVRTNFPGNPAAVFSRAAKTIYEKLNDPSYEPPKSLAAWRPLPGDRVDSTRLPETGKALFGREAELALLDEAWASADKPDTEPTRILAFTAHGGVGKSTLINHWLAAMRRDNYRGATRVFGWSFFSQGVRDQSAASADSFIQGALRFFGDSDPTAGSPWDKGQRLASLVGSERALLVLDGMEPLQSPYVFERGKLRDPSLESLLRRLARQAKGLCLVTTREPLPDIAGRTGVVTSDLEQITPQAGRALLRTARVVAADAELEKLAERFGPHALAVSLLGVYLYEQPGHGIASAKTLEQLPGTRPIDKVLAGFEQWLGDGPERDALRLLGFFDRPADSGCLQALREPPAIAGLTDHLAELNETHWQSVLDRLEKLRLIHVHETELGQKFLDAHPLIREHFAELLRGGESWREGHRRLYEYLTTSTHEGDQPTLEDLEPLYQAVAHGCQAGLQQEVCDEVYIGRILRGTGSGGNYSTFKLGALGFDLGAIACFFEQPWNRVSTSLSEGHRAWLLNEASFSLRALGRLTESIEPMRAGNEGAAKMKDWKNAAFYASNLSELESTLGDMAGAMGDAEQSVTYADLSGDFHARQETRCTQADALHQAGDRSKAETRFREAEEIHAKGQPKAPLLYSIRGFRYCDLLLAATERTVWQIILESGDLSPLSLKAGRGGESLDKKSVGNSSHSTALRAVSQRAKMALEIVLDSSLLDIALNHLTMGRALFFAAILEISDSQLLTTDHSHIDVAVDGLRRSGYMDDLPRGLLTRAWLRSQEGKQIGGESAQEDLEEAWEIAERGPMRLHMADIHLYRARLFHGVTPYPWATDVEGNARGPKDDLAAARKLIEQCGYWRRKEELEDAEEAAKNW